MAWSALLAFTLVALVAVLTPGLDTVTVLRNVVTSGRRGGLAAGLGVSAGCLVWGATSIAGLTASRIAAGVFYLSLLPQCHRRPPEGGPPPPVLPTAPGSAGWGVLLVAIHIGLGQLWLATMVIFAANARRLLARVRVRRWLDRITATTLTGIRVSVALETG